MEKTLRNTDSTFAGIAAIKNAQRDQLALFEAAAGGGRWDKIHGSHYDWWMFPVDSPSSHVLKWSVYADDIAELKRDPAFMQSYRRGVELLMEAWGWDLDEQRALTDRTTDQKWQKHPVRLYKAAYSLWLFGCETEFASLHKYALTLFGRGENFIWNKDLSVFFTQGLDPYSGRQLYQPSSIGQESNPC